MQTVRQRRQQLILEVALDDLFRDHHSDLPLEQQRGAQRRHQQHGHRAPQS